MVRLISGHYACRSEVVFIDSGIKIWAMLRNWSTGIFLFILLGCGVNLCAEPRWPGIENVSPRRSGDVFGSVQQISNVIRWKKISSLEARCCLICWLLNWIVRKWGCGDCFFPRLISVGYWQQLAENTGVVGSGASPCCLRSWWVTPDLYRFMSIMSYKWLYWFGLDLRNAGAVGGVSKLLETENMCTIQTYSCQRSACPFTDTLTLTHEVAWDCWNCKKLLWLLTEVGIMGPPLRHWGWAGNRFPSFVNSRLGLIVDILKKLGLT